MTIKKLLQLKNCILLIVSFFIANSLQAQVARTELRVDKDYLFDLKVELKNDRYTISLATSGAAITNSITVTNFTSSVLRSFVISTMEKKIKPSFIADDTLEMRINLRFIELMAALFNVDQEGQPIAKIKLNTSCIIKSYKMIHSTDTVSVDTVSLDTILIKVKSKKHYNTADSLQIIDAQIVFEDGFIKSIIIKGIFDNTDYSFSNRYPIGITTRKNIWDLGCIKLYNEIGRGNEYIILADVLTYKRDLGVRTNDYSPVDQVILLTKNDEHGLVLKKASSSELFTMNIFSDFVGINENNPNGLIQTEFSKRINVWTKRISFIRIGGIGALTYITPVFEISKIEENNRYMPLLDQSTDTVNNNYANPLQVLRYSTINVRTELNLIDIQTAAVTFNCNFLAGVAVTHVKDSTMIKGKPQFIDETINTFAYGSNLKFIFNPESSWSYTMTGTYLRINNLNDKFIYRTIKNGELSNASKNLWSGELLVAWNTSSDNKLFGRFRYNWEGGNVYNNYSEFQIGFSKKFRSSKAK